MPEFVWLCLFEQDSEYASGHKYVKILNMANMDGSQYVSVTQCSKYGRACLDRVLNIS